MGSWAADFGRRASGNGWNVEAAQPKNPWTSGLPPRMGSGAGKPQVGCEGFPESRPWVVGKDASGTSRLLSRKTPGLLDCRRGWVPEPGSPGWLQRVPESWGRDDEDGLGILGDGFVGGGRRSAFLVVGAAVGAQPKNLRTFGLPSRTRFRSREIRVGLEGFRSPWGRKAGAGSEFRGVSSRWGSGAGNSRADRDGFWSPWGGRRVELPGCSAEKPVDFRTAVEEAVPEPGNPGRLGMGLGVLGKERRGVGCKAMEGRSAHIILQKVSATTSRKKGISTDMS